MVFMFYRIGLYIINYEYVIDDPISDKLNSRYNSKG